MGIGEILNVNIFLPPWFQSVYQWCNQTEARGAAGGLQELASEERGEKGERGGDRQNSIEMVQPVQAMEPSWLTQPWSVAQIFSALKSLSNLTEVAGSSSDLSHLLTSARDLSQTVEIHISAPLQWWKICFISLWCGATCCLGICSGKAKLRGKGLSGCE